LPHVNVGVSFNGGTPKWMVYFMEKRDDLGVPLFQETSICWCDYSRITRLHRATWSRNQHTWMSKKNWEKVGRYFAKNIGFRPKTKLRWHTVDGGYPAPPIWDGFSTQTKKKGTFTTVFNWCRISQPSTVQTVEKLKLGWWPWGGPTGSSSRWGHLVLVTPGPTRVPKLMLKTQT
jgi:hypothetical protein